jgi:Arc/MetJ-type ribon-helix-helix transcriptional regulator
VARKALRLTAELETQIKEAVRSRGFSSVSGFIRAAVQNELRRSEAADSVSEAEARIAGSFNQILREVRAIHTSVQAGFALTDTLAKYLLTCIPEPPAQILDAARARAKFRHHKLLRSAAASMTGGGQNTVDEIVGNGQ